MPAQSLLAKVGLRTATLGSLASLAVAFPLAEGSYDPGAHTAASRVGFYAVAGSKIGCVVNGAEILSIGTVGIGVAGQAPSTSTAVATPASTTAVSSLRLPHGAAPTSPVNGDMWTTTSGLFARINGTTIGPFSAGAGGTISGSIANTQVAFGSGVNAIQGTGDLTYLPSTTGLQFSQAPAAITTSATYQSTLRESSSFSVSTVTGILTYSSIKLAPTLTSATSGTITWKGLEVLPQINDDTAAPQNLYGVWVNINTSWSTATGVYVNAVTAGPGRTATGMLVTGVTTSINSATGLVLQNITSTGGGSAYGISIQSVSGNSGNPSYGLYMQGISGGNPTYGIYQADVGIANFFGSVTGIGFAPDTTTYLNLAQATTAKSSLRLRPGVAPTTPVDGDMWLTTTGVFAQINGSTVGPFGAGGGIAGTIAAGQVAVGSGADTIAGSSALTFSTAAGFAMALGTTAVFTPLGITGSINNYFENNTQNTSNGVTASSDFVATADTGNATTKYVDLGINGSGYTAAIFGAALDAYLYASDNNLNIGTAGTGQGVRIVVGGSSVTTNRVVEFLATTSTYSNKVVTAASATAAAGLNLPHGAAPTSPANGDVWTTTAGLFAQINGATQQYPTLSASNAFTGANTFTSASGLTTLQAATQDAVKLLGRAGGTSSFAVTITPGVLTGSIILTSPLVAGTLTTGAGTANQVATWSGTNALTGGTTLTLTTTSGAGLLANAAGTSTATTTTAGLSQSITYSGIFTTGPVSSVSAAATFSGATATAAVILTAALATTTATGIISNANSVNADYATLTATPGGAVGAIPFIGSNALATLTSAANANFASATLMGSQSSAVFNSANTTGVTIAAGVVGHKVIPSVVTTNGSGSNTITAVYGVWVSPGTFSAASGGTIVITNYYGLRLDTLTTSGVGTTTITNRYGVFQADAAATNSFAGLVLTAASTTTNAGLRLPHGAAPTSPVNGDVWTTTAGMFVQINGGTVGPFAAGGTIGGSIAANQVAVGSGANAIGGSASWTATTTSGALLESFTAGTSAATTATNAWNYSITYSGAIASGNVNGINVAVTSTSGNSAAGMTASGLSASMTFGTANNNAAVNYYGSQSSVSTTASTGQLSGTVTMIASVHNATFNSSDIAPTGLTALASIQANHSMVMTPASGGTTVTTVYGVWIKPGTFSTTTGATTTITTYYGLYVGTLTTSGAGTTTITNKYGVFQADAAATNSFAGLVLTAASTTTNAGLRLPHGSAPTAPVNGDLWTTTGGLFVRINGATLTFSANPIAGTIAANQVAVGNGANTIGGSASWTATTTSGALLEAFTAGTCTATTATNAWNYTVTYSGTVASGSLNGMNVAVTSTSANSAAQTTAAALNTSMVFGTANNSAAVNYYGSLTSVSTTASTGQLSGTVTMIASVHNATFNSSDIATTSLAALAAIQVAPSLVMTPASGGSTVAAVYGIWVKPGTFSTSVGGTTTTVTNFYGLRIDTLTTTGSGTTTITNRYGVYQADTAAKNFFAGVVGVGNQAPVATTALGTPASTTGVSSLNIPHGSAPTSPVNGDMWTTTAGLFVRINSATIGPFGTGTITGNATSGNIAYGNGVNSLTSTGSFQFNGAQMAIGSAPSVTASLLLPAADGTSINPLRLPHGTVVPSPVDGDMWTTSVGLYVRINGTTVGPLGAGTIAGTIANTQVAFGSGANAVQGSASWTAGTTSGALLVTTASGSSTATASTTASDNSITFTGLGSSATLQGFQSNVTVAPTGTVTTSTYRAGSFLISRTTDATSRTIDSTMDAVFASATYTTTATTFTMLANLRAGLFVTTINTNSLATGPTFTNVYGLHTQLNVATATGSVVTTITNYYGLRIDAISATGSGSTTITNRFGVYQADTAALNFFAGNVGLGNQAAATSTALNLPAATTALSSLRMAAGAAPTSPVAGDMWVDSTQLCGVAFVSGIKRYDVGGLFSSNTSLAVTATTPTTMFTTGAGTTTLPANFWAVGKTVRVTIHATYVIGGTAATLTLTVGLGGTTATYTTASQSSITQSLRFELYITCTTTGASGAFMYGSQASTTNNVGAGTTLTGNQGTLSTIDTTGTLAVVCSAAWSTATGAPTLTVRSAVIEVVA